MHLFNVLPLTAAVLHLLGRAQAKAVFAHYMVGSVNEAHVQQDIDNAIAIGLDGFALNIGDPTEPYVNTTLVSLFDYAWGKDFKLFVSMDLTASGAACTAGRSCCNGPSDYDSILSEFLGNGAYYLGPNGLPMISTFQSDGFTIDAWNASGWWSYWGNLVDGLFSWEAAWPVVGDSNSADCGSMSPDIPVINGALNHGKSYMIALSTLQYKDAYGTNLYRPGGLTLPIRMNNILGMASQLDFVEIITWNDGPESHYIGNVWPEASDSSVKYCSPQANFPHTAWQPLVTSFIAAYKTGNTMAPPTGATAIGAMWYKTLLQDATCSGATQPDGWSTGTDSLTWAVVLPAGSKGMQIRATSNGAVISTVAVNPGLNFGSPTGVQAGAQMLQLLNSAGAVVMTATGGACVASVCPAGMFNMNYQVVGLSAGGGNASCK
ncbi:MAG: hypothetical protein ALECFALPRED_005605 [Alectoria fallacina]|uniref:Glycoside hydrolase family 71 protein n=1 Tax=Alectoria fallacina TaxID=1903189 RepID=A0A8H3G2A8_9LECA|nr:MAG: hypothetical protein ALECFALPRED_005605 [Alectoria fallacina]